MNKEQESNFAMALKVRNFSKKNNDELATMPAVMPHFVTVRSKITELILADAGGRSDVSGYAIGKSVTREKLEKQSLQVSNALASYAVDTDNYILQKKADFPKSAWYQFTEEELVTQATVVKNLAIPLNMELVAYGATEADITILSMLVDSFTNVISDPTLAADMRKNDNARAVVILAEIKTVLTEKLDVLMRSFEVNNKGLYSLYLSARAIDINGSMMQPTAVSEVKPATVVTVHTVSGFNPDTFYTLQNLGTAPVFFSLSAVENTVGTEEIMLNTGETRSRLAENLAQTGTFLIVRNPGEGVAKVKVWVE